MARVAVLTFALREGRDPTRDDRGVDVGVTHRAGSCRGGPPAALTSIAGVRGHGVIRKYLRLIPLALLHGRGGSERRRRRRRRWRFGVAAVEVGAYIAERRPLWQWFGHAP